MKFTILIALSLALIAVVIKAEEAAFNTGLTDDEDFKELMAKLERNENISDEELQKYIQRLQDKMPHMGDDEEKMDI